VADDGGCDADEGEEVLRLALVAAVQAAAARKPGDRWFNGPAVAAELLGRFHASADDGSAQWHVLAVVAGSLAAGRVAERAVVGVDGVAWALASVSLRCLEATRVQVGGGGVGGGGQAEEKRGGGRFPA
jgi:hypothetical protein